mgnify:CR=1 FL=1
MQAGLCDDYLSTCMRQASVATIVVFAVTINVHICVVHTRMWITSEVVGEVMVN